MSEEEKLPKLDAAARLKFWEELKLKYEKRIEKLRGQDITITLPDGREVYIGWKCGRVLCDCENDSSCPHFMHPAHVGHLEHWKAKKAKIEKKLVRKTKNQSNKEKLQALIDQANF